MIKIAVKLKIGKLPEFVISMSALVKQILADGFKILPLTTEHIIAYDRVPFFEEHRDPFDRLILATALYEGWPVMLADQKFSRYNGQVEIIW